jgi:cytochrome c-type biogenesis protein CcmH
MSMQRKILPAILAVMALAMLMAGTVLAQEPLPSDDEVNAIAKQLYCPVCENIPLDVCPTQACQQWRQVIRDKLSEGWTEDQIKTYFVDQYGDRVLAEPPPRGLNLLVYIVPPLAFLAGAVVLFQAMKAWRAQPVEPSSPASPSDPSEDDEYIKRVEEELARR